MINKGGARDKAWKLSGQTGWSYVGFNDDRELQLQLALVVTTKDNGEGPTEKIEDDDIVNVVWAMQTDNHTDTLSEYEAGFATYYRGAPGSSNTTPSKVWSVYQTVTKVLNVTGERYVASTVIPAQKDAETKILNLGDDDLRKDLYWGWDQSQSVEEEERIAFVLTRSEDQNKSLTLGPDSKILGKVGLQAYIAGEPSKISYGIRETEWIWADKSSYNDGGFNSDSAQLLTSASAFVAASLVLALF